MRPTEVCVSLFGSLLLSASALAQPSAVLTISQDAAGDVIATVAGTVPECGVTASDATPTFSLQDHVVTVVQDTPGILCVVGTPPGTTKPYDVTLDLGRLPAGTYTVRWNFPALSASYTVTGEPGFQIGPRVTGFWLDATQAGQGFELEVLATTPPQLLATWLVFDPSGNATWIAGTGAITGNEAVVQGYQVVAQGYQATGPGVVFPPNFNAANLHVQLWGSLTFTFDGCNSGRVSWQSVHQAYGSGTLPLTRLTLPAGLSCP